MKRTTIALITLLIGIVMFAALFLAATRKSSAFFAVAAVAAVGAMIFNYVFDRCPSCHKYLGRFSSSGYCRHCGKKVMK